MAHLSLTWFHEFTIDSDKLKSMKENEELLLGVELNPLAINFELKNDEYFVTVDCNHDFGCDYNIMVGDVCLRGNTEDRIEYSLCLKDNLPDLILVKPILAISEALTLHLNSKKTGADCEFHTSDKRVLLAHRWILTFHSEVFNAMFRNDLEEALTGKIMLTESYEAVEALLTYMYCGRVSPAILDTHGLELLELAARYKIKSLTDICATFLAANPNIETAYNALVISKTHELHVMEESMEEFVYTHMVQIMGEDNLDFQLLNDICKKRKRTASADQK